MSETIYIITNESMPGIIKVGRTDDLEAKIRSLNTAEIPVPSQCFYAVKVSNDANNAARIEKSLHEAFRRAHQNKDYFYASAEQAKAFLEIAEIMGGEDVTPAEDIVSDPQDKRALEIARQESKERHDG